MNGTSQNGDGGASRRGSAKVMTTTPRLMQTGCAVACLYVLLTFQAYLYLPEFANETDKHMLLLKQHRLLDRKNLPSNGRPLIRTASRIRNSLVNNVDGLLHDKNQNRFPISVRDAPKEDMEEIPHPGQLALKQLRTRTYDIKNLEDITKMKVPKFWTPPFHPGTRGGDNGGIMTKSQALSIGSKIRPAPGTFDKSDLDEDGMLETIFVAIASYRDDECPRTLEGIYRRAKYPTRVRVVIIDQLDIESGDVPCDVLKVPCDRDPEQALCKYRHLIDVYQMEARLAVGPVFARHIGYRMYRGEYFAMQVDAHVRFVQDWDASAVRQWRQTSNEMAVLSTYLSGVDSYDEETGQSMFKYRPIMCNTVFTNERGRQYLRNDVQPMTVATVRNTPMIHPYWAAGWSFSRGHFIVNVPYDQHLPMIFQGEESNMGLRAFTYGYDMYAPWESVGFHIYAEGKNNRPLRKHTFWENANLYQGVMRKSMDRLLGIIKMNPEVDPKTWNHAEEDKYGLGRVRDVSKFFETFGIDVQNKTTEGHLCRFIDNKETHAMFALHLRPDGMGIDYSKITYRFHDPDPDQ